MSELAHPDGPLAGNRDTVNFRPLLAASGRHPVFRSAALLGDRPDRLPRPLRNGRPGTCLDLRTDREVTRDGAPEGLTALGWQWARHPIDDTGTAYGVPEILERTLAAARFAWHAAEHCPVVVACSLGKDRTGRVAAVLQHWHGRPEDAVVADFLLSNTELAIAADRLLARWRTAGAVTPVHPTDLDAVLRLLRTDPRWAVPPGAPRQNFRSEKKDVSGD
jgi:hypothetical protein